MNFYLMLTHLSMSHHAGFGHVTRKLRGGKKENMSFLEMPSDLLELRVDLPSQQRKSFSPSLKLMSMRNLFFMLLLVFFRLICQ